MDRVAVLKLIERACVEEWKGLYLKFRQLAELPPEIGLLGNLVELDLGRNMITELPTEIGQLTHLHALNLWQNQLHRLPPEIGRLTNLLTLDLACNKLAELPPEIGELSKLETLKLWMNKLSRVPSQIGRLANLPILDLGDNELSELPAEIGQLTQLHGLSLWQNQLDRLPPEIGQLTNLKHLNLAKNKLTELPPEIGQLTHLCALNLRQNQVARLPREIGLLSNLADLDLRENMITELPPEIGQLTHLQNLRLRRNQVANLPREIGLLGNLLELDLGGNMITELPTEIGQLVRLQTLNLWQNRLGKLPRNICQLSSLVQLDLVNNRLIKLPPQAEGLAELRELKLAHNKLAELPPQLGRLANLCQLHVYGNPLLSPPAEIVAQGTQAIRAYLRGQLERTRPQWISKLLVVGEGGVGKTATLRSLLRQPFDPELTTTHGIQIFTVELDHPAEADVVMELNGWDFGGQEIYHATHQFFLTNRSLFLLAWNARHGYEQGKLYYWLDAIQARAPDSPVLIVATHVDERDADLPLSELCTQYPQIAGHFEISNKTGEGVEKLRTVLTDTAAGLPLMGETWPGTWLDAAEAIHAKEEKHITPAQMFDTMSQQGVSGDDARILAIWLHELGELLYYQEDDEINDEVILKPQWVTEYISKVLESKEVIDGLGIFTRAHMRELWADLTHDMQDHFLRLMERFDLSYRTLENREISLVVERLPLDPSDYSQEWDAIKDRQPCREISMRFRLNTIPPGIPTWFIARSHRFTTHAHWRSGALFADGEERRHLALVRALTHDREIQLTVRGPCPHNFFVLLKDGLELTLARFPGLKIERTMPCPGHDSESCDHEFDYRNLQRAIEKKPPAAFIQCPTSLEMVSVPGLMFGLHWSTRDAVLERIDSLEDRVLGGQEEIKDQVQELRELAQREFTKSFRLEQSKIEAICPSVFVLRPRETSSLVKAIKGRTLDLQLYCEAPGEWHPVAEGGRYKIDDPAGWLKATGPYTRKLVVLLKYVAPLAGPWVACAMPAYEALLKNDIKLMTELVKKLPDLEAATEYGLTDFAEEGGDPYRVTGAALRALYRFLDQKDLSHNWGGLKKVLTPEGHFLWLCEHHAKEYKL